ncbi:hypothetical protein GQ44DRAFT_706271 [Phaeosphaeriaceae sp. PMI808]|nr:hypothetical protein GQ44DRAFT_706271 [Phaeosphaeriaceae sp. PMI808]
MRLLEIQQDGTLNLTKDLIGDDEIPAYAILSHTWEKDEVLFDDLKNGTGKNKAGYRKIWFCAQQAQHDGLRYIWIDTCCIDKANTVELQDAINSMFRWYRDAVKCYIFLSDVSSTDDRTDSKLSQFTWEPDFRCSRWFTRGWTLQELLAPRLVYFFSQDGKHLGERHELRQEIHEITNIPITALAGAPLNSFSVDDRLSWVEKRHTTRKEDKAYSLLGIFGVSMYLNYGEGRDNAFKRLWRAIDEDLRESCQPQVLLATHRGRSTFSSLASYYIPFVKNQYFVGRKDELNVLSQKLLVDRGCSKMSIVGLGGAGKTQVALQFVFTVKETMSAVSIFWMPALSMESFEQACVGIVAALQIGRAGPSEDDAKELVREHLSAERAGRWLLVLDNADDPNLLFGTEKSRGIVDYLPESENGKTVFTTRVQEVAVSLTRGDVLELGPMGQADAAVFLEKSLINKSLIQDRIVTAELLDELAYLPLAIAQAAAYLNMNKTSIVKYLQLLRSTEQDATNLVSKEFRDHTRYRGSANAIASTWVVSFSQLRERDAIAADLLTFISCIEWKAIPRSLLPKVQPEERMEEAIGTLCGYSFVSRREGNRFEEGEGDEEWYDLHRLVHLATRIWTSKHGDTADVAERAMKHVAEVFPTDDFANRAIWRGYMPHAVQLLKTRQPCSLNTRSRLSSRVGQCLLTDGRVLEAVQWLEECHQLRLVLDTEHADRLASQHGLASAYRINGQVKEAVELLEHVVAVKAKLLKEEHPDRLASQHELASAYRVNGQVKEAVELLEHVVAVGAKVLKEEHPDRLASQHELASAYQANGQVKEAVELLEHVVAVEAKLLKEEHPDRLASQHVLAIAYRVNGQVKEAVELLEHVVAVKAKLLKEEHPDRLASQHELASAYRVNGQVKEAVELLEYVVAVGAKVLKEEHPDRLASQHELARAYQANGQVKEAVELLEHVVAARAHVLKEEHPSRLASQQVLAIAYRVNGQVKEAVELLEHVVAVEAKLLKEEHPDRLTSQHELARAYQANGQVKEAVELLEHVVKIRNATLAKSHPDRQASQGWLLYMNSRGEDKN